MRLTPEQLHERRWWTLGVLCLSLLVIGVDNTILNVALPSIVRSLHAQGSQLQWIIDAYTLVFAGLLLTAGSLGDRLGRKGALTAGLVLFGGFSALASQSRSATMLIVARGLMGIGGAFIYPTTLSILTNTFSGRERPMAAVAVAGGAGDQQEPGEHERVRVDDPLQVRRGCIELARERRQRGVDDRAVDHDGEQREAQDDQDGPAGGRAF